MLRNNGYKVVTTSIHNGYDFLTCEVPEGVNCIITNPPFSLKNQFLQRCYDLKLPFALLLPIQALDTKQRFDMFSKHGLDLLLFDKRVNYIGSNGSPPFTSAWFTNKVLPERLVFERLEK